MQVGTQVGNRLLRVPAVAEQLDMSTRTVWRLIADGQIEPLRIGRSVRFTQDALERFKQKVAARAGSKDHGES
jgi:excisionase family DNA binding protein